MNEQVERPERITLALNNIVNCAQKYNGLTPAEGVQVSHDIRVLDVWWKTDKLPATGTIAKPPESPPQPPPTAPEPTSE